MIFITLGKQGGRSRLRQSRGGQEGFQMQDTVDQESLGWRRETGSHCSIEHIKIRDYMITRQQRRRCCYRREEKIKAGMRMPRMETCDPPGSK